MPKSWLILLLRFLAIAVAFTYPGIKVLAQNITLDGTLGTSGTLTGPNYTVPQSIGQTVGNNLFHSFGQFNLNANEAAIFQSNPNIKNILSRVTGGNQSVIDGLIRTTSRVNLFFINPSGIIFGQNARLDVGGSFVASTANSFVFSDGSEFSAINPQTLPLLTMNITPGLQYGANLSGTTITNAGNLYAGQDLILAADNLNLQGKLRAGRDLTLQAQNTIQVRDSATIPFVATAGSKLVVQGNQSVDILALNHPESGFFSGGNILLRSRNAVGGDTHYTTGGNFQIERLDSSLGNLSSFDGSVIRASRDVSFDSYTGASLHILAGGSVTIAGDVTIIPIDRTGSGLVENVLLSDGKTLVPINGQTRRTLDIRAGTRVVGTTERDSTNGNIFIGGVINNPGSTVFLTNQYEPNSNLLDGKIVTKKIDTSANLPDSDGGSITIDARSHISTANLNSSSFYDVSGNGGSIRLLSANGNITTGSLESYAGLAGYYSTSITSGTGGAISLYAPNGSITTNNLNSSSESLSYSSASASGAGGEINLYANGNISTGDIISHSESQETLAEFSSVSGNGGKISLYSANGNISTGSYLDSSSFSNAPGNGGAISLFAAKGSIRSAGNITSSTTYSGVGGAISLYAGSGDISTKNLNSSSLSPNGSGTITLNALDGNITTGNLNSSSYTYSYFIPAGAGGAIKIDAVNGDISTGDLSSSSYSFKSPAQDGGHISLRAGGIITTADMASFSFSTLGISGKGGDVNLYANKNVRTASISSASNIGSGNINIATGGDVSFGSPLPKFASRGSLISSDTLGTGKGGDIEISAKSIFLTNGSQISASTYSGGQGGSINLRASNIIEVSGISPNNQIPGPISTPGGFVPGGLARIPDSTNLGGYILTGIAPGNPLSEPRPDGTQYPSGVFSQASVGSTNNAGNLFLEAKQLIIRDGGAIAATTFGKGNAGNILVRAIGDITIANGFMLSGVASGAQGNSGIIDIQSHTLSISPGGILQTQTLGGGNAGNIWVNAVDSVSLSNNAQIRASVETGATGKGGDIDIWARSLSLSDGAQIVTSTNGAGKAGNIALNVAEDTTLSGNNTGILAITKPAGNLVNRVAARENGDAGDLHDTAQDLTTQPGSFISSISGVINGDNDVDLYKIFVAGDKKFSATTVGGTVMDTRLFLFDANGRGIYGNDSGQGSPQSTLPSNDAFSPTAPGIYYLAVTSSDNLPLSASGKIFDNGAGVLAPLANDSLIAWNNYGLESGGYSVFLNGTAVFIPRLNLEPSGDGGTISVRSGSLFVRNGAQLAVSTLGQGNAGDITIDARAQVKLDGVGTNGVQSGLFANTASGSTGKGGNLVVNTRLLQVENGASITVSSPQGQAGNLSVSAKNINLNQGNITAETAITRGEEAANIKLQGLDLLLMRNRSRISAQANGNANGGNINIDAAKGFVIAPLRQDNDIIANAFEGRGGNVKITTQGIFGLAEGKVTLDNDSNDIDASSKFGAQGKVTFNVPDTDPSRGLIELPINLVDASQQIAQGCTPRRGQTASRFISTGRGGIPENPYEPLRNRAVINNWVTVRNNGSQQTREIKEEITIKPTSEAIVEAQGLVVNSRGEVELVAQVSGNNFHNSSQQAAFSCNGATY